jgi:conjugative relaxase-like TrwC/TraI family protein
MLTIYGQTSAAAVKSYFSAADYYSEGQETVGRWGGKLAPLLGLRGTVEKAEFDRMCDNLHPVTGERLTQRTNDNRRVGYDFVLSGPKSFSIALALAPEELRAYLQKAFDDAALETMEKHVEPDMQTRVRKDGAFENRTTGNMCWAWFGHSTSRPVPGFVADMQEHAHFFVFNATDDAVEERIKAGEFGGIKRDGEYYTAVFYSLLARNLVNLGFGIDKRGGKEWELAGVLQSMIETFSKRRDQVLDTAEELGITQKWRIAELTPATRSKKDKELSKPELRREWDAQLTDVERDALAAVYRREATGDKPVTAAEAVAWAIAHLSDKLSVFAERELKRVALLYGLGSVTLDQIEAELPRQGVFTEVIDGRLMATTEKLQEEENALVKFAAGGRGTVEPVGVAAGLTRKLASGKTLNDGQWEAVAGLLNSANRVNLVEGPAGAGKSSMLAKYDEGMRRAGQQVHYFATTAKAAEVLQEDGFKDTKTVAHLLMNEKLQSAIKGSRVVVDEVSMLDHKQAVRLFELARNNDLTLTLVGDPFQHGAVARGAIMRILKDYACLKPFRLTEILRQENPEYKAAAKLLSEGKTVEGFDAIDGMGRIAEIGDDTDRNRHIAADYLQALEDRKSVLVVAPTHAEAKGITAAIRQELRAAECLEGDDREFTRLAPVDTSQAERGLATTYRPGDVIQFHQNAKGGFTKGDRLTVTDPAAVPLSQAAKFSVYRPEKIALAAGDKIRFTGTVGTMDGEHTLRNGMTKTVAEITPGGNIRLDNGWVVGKDAGHFRHGYVETSFGSQGRTVDQVILGMSSASIPAMNMEQLYVSASRAKQWIRLYTDDKAEIRDAVKRSSQKLAALDLKRPVRQAVPQPAGVPVQRVAAKPRRWHRLRKHLEQRRRLYLIDRTRAERQPQPVKQKERQADHGYSR